VANSAQKCATGFAPLASTQFELPREDEGSTDALQREENGRNKFSRRREGAKKCHPMLCVFAPLREKHLAGESVSSRRLFLEEFAVVWIQWAKPVAHTYVYLFASAT
jgi:hypothetical protein